MDAAMHGNHCRAGHPQDPDETTPSDVSERPSVEDVESDTGSAGGLETRSLKDHKGEAALAVYRLVFQLKSLQVENSAIQMLLLQMLISHCSALKPVNNNSQANTCMVR